MKRSSFKGSITVEASFIMPIVIFTIIALIYMAFYAQDINRIQSSTDISLHKASFALKHSSDLVTGRVFYENIGDRGVFFALLDNSAQKEEAIKKLMERYLSGKLYMLKEFRVKIVTTNSKLTVVLIAKGTIPLPILKEVFQPYSEIIIYEEYIVHNPAETLRSMEVILDTGLKIKGVNALQKKLKELLK